MSKFGRKFKFFGIQKIQSSGFVGCGLPLITVEYNICYIFGNVTRREPIIFFACSLKALPLGIRNMLLSKLEC